MMPRQSILLSPYRLPTETTLYLADEEVACFLNAWRALWHPAALACSAALPRVGSPYDYEQPSDDLLIAVPEHPPLTLPDDWRDRAGAAGSIVFTATADWDATLTNLRQALREKTDDNPQVPKLLGLPAERTAGFYAVGYGVAVLGALFEAMQQESLLPSDELTEDIALAVAAYAQDDETTARERLQSAANRLLEKREVVYPVTVHVIDLALSLDQLPPSFDRALPMNVLATGEALERLPAERLEILKERVTADVAEVIGGCYREREEPLLPLESQLANLRSAQAVHRKLLGQELRVFGRRRGGLHSQMPLLLQSSGITKCLLLSFDESLVPSHGSTVVAWPSADGKQVDAFTRMPQPADSPQTYFHLAHYLHQTILQDQSATLALMHRNKPAVPSSAADAPRSFANRDVDTPRSPVPVWYGDWLELSLLAPSLGKWSTLSSYFNEVMTGDYTSAAQPDEFSTDYLTDRTTLKEGELSLPGGGGEQSLQRHRPISEFASLTRNRRKLDAALTFCGLLHALRGTTDPSALVELEECYEKGQADDKPLQDAIDTTAAALAARLVARGADRHGWLVLNPCAFARRVPIELAGLSGAVAIEGPVKAAQLDGDTARLVVEVPALGFAWIPRPQTGAPSAPSRIKTADKNTIRNEFFEAEIDPTTGGLRTLRDVKNRVGRLAQQLVWNPGSTMKATSIHVTASGPALGEITTEGELLDDQGQPCARFKQRYRAWLGRPVLELRIELEPLTPIEGYAWHAYFACRVAWRDEVTPLLRGFQGQPIPTSATRPESPDFVEIRVGRPNTVLFPAGLPFHQRHGGRMLDTILIAEGETARTFDLTIGIDREQPMQTALGVASPVAVVPTTKGPPHVGASGWLFHLDAPHVVLSTLRPAEGDAVVVTLLETANHYGPVSLRCVRNPVQATVMDLAGNELYDANIEGDAVQLDMTACDLMRVRVRFS